THPTTVPSVAIDPRGQPFSWTDALQVQGQTPVALLEHDGTVFLFTGTPSIEDPEHNASTGLRTWVSTDGTDWELRSVIEENYEVNTVISSRFGLLAAGFDPANGDGLVWQSADGNTWTQMLVS